jgi:hypothetical protein
MTHGTILSYERLPTTIAFEWRRCWFDLDAWRRHINEYTVMYDVQWPGIEMQRGLAVYRNKFKYLDP